MLEFDIESRDPKEELIVFSIKGYLDSKVAIDFYEFISEVDEPYSRCIFDCEGMTGVSSLGLSIFIRIRKKFIQKRIIPIMVGFNQEILDLFEFLGFGKLFYITKNMQSARNILNTLHPLPIKKTTEPDYKFSDQRNIGVDTVEEETISEIIIESLAEDKDTYVPVFLSESRVMGLDDNEMNELPEFQLKEDYPKPDFKKKRDYEFSIPFITKSDAPEKEELRESIILEEENRGYSKFTELIINCGNCSTKMLIKKQGKHKCPNCGAAFLLRQSGSISTIEKL